MVCSIRHCPASRFAVTALREFVVASCSCWCSPPSCFTSCLQCLSSRREQALSDLKLLVLPVATLVIVTFPYIFRMMRGTLIEVMESDFVEMARLKGVPPLGILLIHAFINAIAPTIQVVGITFLYLAGGIVIVEDVFAFPGIGQGLVNAVTTGTSP